jgi:type I restriction enzyme, S subunit
MFIVMSISIGVKQDLLEKKYPKVRIDEVCDFIVPGRNKPKNLNGEIPWITIPDMRDGEAIFESRLGYGVNHDEIRKTNNKIVPENSVIMSCVGDLGIVGYTTRQVVINQQLHAFIPRAEVDLFYLMYTLQTKKKFLESIATKTTVSYLNKERCNSIPLALPPISEQKIVAKILNDIDTFIRQLEKLIAKKRDIKQATMQQLLTGKTRLSGFKADWITLKLDSIIDVLTDYTANGSFESLKNNVQYFENQNYAALVRTTDLGKRKFEPARFTDKKGYNFLSKTALYGGELILANVGSIGKVFRVPHFDMPMTLAPNTYLIKFTSNIDQEFMCQYLNTDLFYKKLMSQVGSSTLQAINKQNLRNIEILIPSVRDEQETISKLLVSMDLDLEASIRKWEKLKLLKQGMTQELLTGRISLV